MMRVVYAGVQVDQHLALRTERHVPFAAVAAMAPATHPNSIV